MATSLLSALANLAGLLSLALLLALALRQPLRRGFGARVAYPVWALAPVMLLAALLPEHVRPRVISVEMAQLTSFPVTLPASGAFDWSAPLLLAYLAGLLLMATGFWRQHWRFLQGLGELTLRDGLLHSEALPGGAVSLGLWAPVVVVPRDFALLYTSAEQELIVHHERIHARRGDAWANLLQAALQCAFWFNPLVHFAARRFRLDQELACDAAVVAARPDAARTYARALLASHTAFSGHGPTLACHWHAVHPVKERIMNLQHPFPTRRRHLGGTLVLGSLLLGAAVAGLAGRVSAQTAPAGADYAVDTSFRFAGQTSAPRVRVQAGEPFSIRSDANGKQWSASLRIEQAGAADAVWIRASIDAGGASLAKPVMLGKLGEPARVSIDTAEGPFELSIVVAALPK